MSVPVLKIQAACMEAAAALLEYSAAVKARQAKLAGIGAGIETAKADILKILGDDGPKVAAMSRELIGETETILKIFAEADGQA